MSGADADALDRLAVRFEQSARRLAGGEARLARSLHASPWRGRSAEDFRRRWDTEFHRDLAAAVQFLDGAGEVLQHNARQQREASSSASGAIAGRAAGGSGRAGLGIDPGQLTDAIFDLLDIFKVFPKPMGFGIGIGSGLWDLFMRRDGYGGQYHGVESLMDLLAVGAGVVGIGALLLGGGALVVGGAMIAAGVIKAVDMFFGTSVGKAFLHGTADLGRSAWRAASGAVRNLWSGARSLAESGVHAVRDSAVDAARRAVSAPARTVRGLVDAGSRLVAGPLRTGQRLVPVAR